MYYISVENQKGNSLALTEGNGYQVVDISGLNPPNANINTTNMAMGDGSIFNSSSLANRNIIITLYIPSDLDNKRIDLYKYFRPKQFCRLYFRNAKRNVYIDGYVETFDITLFAITQKVQISIICPSPTLKDTQVQEYNFSWTNDNFQFPFAIEETGVEFGYMESISYVNVINNGDTDTGVTIELNANGNVLNPTIRNLATGERFTINFEMIEGDLIKITTGLGNKKITLLRDGVETNIINYVQKNPSWFTLSSGDNPFSYSCDEGTGVLNLKFSLQNEYLGV